MNDESKSPIKVEEIKKLTPHNEALYEAGKVLLIESITVSREFCKFMITIASSAVPIHLGLLKLILPQHYTLSVKQGILASIPTILFLISTIIFTVSYYPQAGNLSLDIIEEIEQERTKTLNRRKNISIWGFMTFCIAVISMIICLMYYLTTLPT